MQAILKSIVDGTTEAITRSRTALAGLPAQVTAGLDAAIKAQVAAGTLITKADHDTQISAATVQATTTAQAGLTANLTKATQRQTALATAGLTAPGNDILLADDATFTAWQTDQTARKTELEPFKLGADRFKALMGATKDAYTAAVVLIKEVKAGPVAARSAISPLESHSEVTQPANTVLAFL
jgi:hypothetical protein